jgi:hypothetical protein
LLRGLAAKAVLLRIREAPAGRLISVEDRQAQSRNVPATVITSA